MLAEDIAERVERWVLGNLCLDAFAERGLGNAYRVLSLYLDTPSLDVFHRTPPHKRRKLRLRSYGGSAPVFLEQKMRKGDRVRKRRTPISAAELHRFNNLTQAEGGIEWPGVWFERRVATHALRPAFQVACVRTAFVGADADPIRLTIDRNLCGLPNPHWQFHEDAGVPLLPGHVVLELKYRSAMPALFKHLLADMALSPAPMSKYRTAVRAWNGAAATNGNGHNGCMPLPS